MTCTTKDISKEIDFCARMIEQLTLQLEIDGITGYEFYTKSKWRIRLEKK